MFELTPFVISLLAEIFGPLPRQGPGNTESTARAFSMVGSLPDHANVLDIGCGTGAQTMALAKLTSGDITALDIFDWALDGVTKRAEREGLLGRVRTVKQSMDAMDFAPDTFDLIWSEGALYLMGFGNALKTCRRLLKPGGYLAASEMSWFDGSPPREARDFFAEGYPDMKSVEANLELVAESELQLVGHFHLPYRAWWDDFFTPMRALLPELRQKYAYSPEAIRILDDCELEMAIHAKYSESYGYEFFVCRRPVGD